MAIATIQLKSEPKHKSLSYKYIYKLGNRENLFMLWLAESLFTESYVLITLLLPCWSLLDCCS